MFVVTSDASQTIRCMDRASLEKLLGQGLSLAEIGRRFGRHEATVAYWVEKHGLQAVNRTKHAARGGLSRDELERLVASGHSISQIADQVDRSKGTVRHWLRAYGLETRGARHHRAPTTSIATDQVRVCPRHGATTFRQRRDGGYRCLACRAEAVTRRRRKVKAILVEEAGGRCISCGYDKCVAALEFHHLMRTEKRFAPSALGVARSLEKARAEASKCVLLCANCHAEVEAGVRSLP